MPHVLKPNPFDANLCLRDAYLDVNLQALQYNATKLKEALPFPAKLMPVVKANAYGHDARAVTQSLWQLWGEAHIARFAVATLPEALALQAQLGTDLPVLMMNMPPLRLFQTSVETLPFLSWCHHNLALTVFRLEHLQALEAFSQACTHHAVPFTPWRVHVKVDTGMHRIGVPWDNAIAFLREVYRLHQAGVLVWEGLYTHFAMGGHTPQRWQQLSRFGEVLQALTACHIPLPPMIHASNTDSWVALQHDYQTLKTNPLHADADKVHQVLQHLNVYRVGIALYGYEDEGALEALGLRPVMGLYARLNHVQCLAVGEGVSYDYHFKAESPTWIGTLPLGYADGVHRQLSGGMQVKINGVFCPQIGTITMDQLMIDLTPLLDAYPDTSPSDYLGALVCLIDNTFPVDTLASCFPQPSLAQWAKVVHSIPYELMCSLNARLEKVFSE